MYEIFVFTSMEFPTRVLFARVKANKKFFIRPQKNHLIFCLNPS